jgi:ABC-2 type transport system ATP-binding protein
MLHRPGLLLLDEATVGLDIGSRESVIEIVRGLVAREGLGVLWATHLIDEIAHSDLVIVLHKGRVMFNGTVPQLLAAAGASNPRDAFRNLTGTQHAEAA